MLTVPQNAPVSVISSLLHMLLDAGYMFIVLALFLIGMIQLLLAIRW